MTPDETVPAEPTQEERIRAYLADKQAALDKHGIEERILLFVQGADGAMYPFGGKAIVPQYTYLAKK